MNKSETTNALEIEFYKWFARPDSPVNLDVLSLANTKVLLKGFKAGWQAKAKAMALVFTLPEGYLDEEPDDEY